MPQSDAKHPACLEGDDDALVGGVGDDERQRVQPSAQSVRVVLHQRQVPQQRPNGARVAAGTGRAGGGGGAQGSGWKKAQHRGGRDRRQPQPAIAIAAQSHCYFSLPSLTWTAPAGSPGGRHCSSPGSAPAWPQQCTCSPSREACRSVWSTYDSAKTRKGVRAPGQQSTDCYYSASSHCSNMESNGSAAQSRRRMRLPTHPPLLAAWSAAMRSRATRRCRRNSRLGTVVCSTQTREGGTALCAAVRLALGAARKLQPR